MSAVCQSEYSSSKDVALNWWRFLPDNTVSVCGLNEHSQPCDASQPHFHPKDGSAVWFVWIAANPKDRLMVGAIPIKQPSSSRKMDIHWWSSLKPVAEIVEQTLISKGAVCTRFPINSKN